MPISVPGYQLIAPQVVSVVTETPLVAQQPVNSLVVAVIAPADGGTPRTFVEQYSYSQSRQVFRSGAMLDLLRRVYGPAQGAPGAYKTLCYRVNAGVASSGVIKDATAATVISVQARDAGLHTNQIRLKVEAGSTAGYKVSVQGYDSTGTLIRDNLARPMLSVQYTGTGTAPTLTISTSQLTTTMTGGAAGDAVTLPFASYPKLQNLADALAGTGVYAVTVLTDGQRASSTLDEVSAQSISSAYSANAHVQAVVDYLNNDEPYVLATRVSGKAIAAMVSYATLTSGSNGSTVTTTDYQNALTALQALECNIVIVASEDSAVHAMVDAHCQLMSQTGANKERVAIVGGALGETVPQTVARAQAISSFRTALVYPGLNDTDDLGNSTAYSPAYAAAAVAGLLAGQTIGQPATRKPVRCISPVVAITPTDQNTLLLGGVLPIEASTTEGARIVQSILTYTGTTAGQTNLLRREISSRLAADVLVRSVRMRLAALIGTAGGPLLAVQAKSIAETALKEAETNGLIVGSDKTPAYSELTASQSGDTITVSFKASVVTPGNYIVLNASLSSYNGN